MKWAAFFVLIGLVGCTTSLTYREQVNLTIGYTTDRLKGEWGRPDEVAPLSDGREV